MNKYKLIYHVVVDESFTLTGYLLGDSIDSLWIDLKSHVKSHVYAIVVASIIDTKTCDIVESLHYSI